LNIRLPFGKVMRHDAEMPTRIVFVPGLMCDADVWAAQCTAFGDRSIVADHALLDSLPAMAAAILAAAPATFALVGHSMGGRVALEVMRTAPDRVTHLALLDTGFEPIAAGDAGQLEKEKRHELLEIARAQGMHAMAVAWARGMVHQDRLADTAFMQRIYAMIARKTPEHFAAQIRALLNRPDACDVLGKIRCPTLVLCGLQDTWSPFSRHEAMNRRIATSELIGVDQCGHMSPMEQPQLVTSAVHKLLARG
jgi:pimeloyl-ACP methyl ester carboxylesterase